MTTLRIAIDSIGNSSTSRRSTVVEVSTLLDNGQMNISQHVLDYYLGNDDGSLSTTTGTHFASSARNVRISNDRLYADLVNRQGVAKAADIGLWTQPIQESEEWTHCFIIGDDSHCTPRRIVPSVVLGLGDPCRHLRLQDRFLLTAGCWGDSIEQPHYITRTLNLDFCLGNRNGSFDIDGQNFSLTARNVRLNGMILSAELRNLSREWKLDEINLQRVVCCSKGRLLAIKGSRRLCSQAPLNHETMPTVDTKQQPTLVACPLYTSLEGRQNVIRVCYIESGTWSDPIRCRMVTRVIDQPESYMCLSYVWGDNKNAFTIEVNGQSVSVSASLWDALRHLRWHGTAGALWVDALCINQDDVQERSAQVLQMAKIYATAEQVIIWLGAFGKRRDNLAPGIEIEEREFGGFLRSLADKLDVQEAAEEVARNYFKTRKATAPPLNAMIVALIKTFYRFVYLPWFHRTWTVQEYILASRSVFVFGAQVVSKDTLTNSYTTLQAFETSLKTGSGAQNTHFNQHFRNVLSTIISRLFDLMNMALVSRLACSDRASWKEDAMDAALILLQSCRSRTCSDPRDKLLAFANVASSAFGSVHADYSVSTADIFREFTLNVIQQMGNLDIWTLVQPLRDDDSAEVKGLPTWVVDWTAEGGHGNLKHFLHKKNFYRPLSTYSKDFTVVSDRRVLIVQGTKFDAVSKTTTDTYHGYGHAYTLGRNQLTPWIRFLGIMGLDKDTARSEVWDRFVRLMMHDQFPASAADADFDIPAREKEHRRWRIATAEDKRLFYEWAVKDQEYHGIDTAAIVPGELQVVVDLVSRIATGSKLFQSAGDRLGLCPPSAQKGDEVWHVGGSGWPVILRPDPVAADQASHTTTYQLIGTCYVSDISEEMVEQALGHAEQVRVR